MYLQADLTFVSSLLQVLLHHRALCDLGVRLRDRRTLSHGKEAHGEGGHKEGIFSGDRDRHHPGAGAEFVLPGP